MLSAFLHRPGDRLSAAELSACRIDGVVHELGTAYIPADVPDTIELRARSLAPLLSPMLAGAGPTAAWMLGAGDEPPPVAHARPTTTRRIRASSYPQLRIHEVPVPEGDLRVIAGVATTTPGATAFDLARVDEPGQLRWLLALANEFPDAVDDARARMRARERLPGKRTALERLERIYELVTR